MTDAKKRWRAHRRADERGIAALVMVLGVILIMVVGSVVLANATIESQQINTTSLLTHYAYRALEAGITDFDYNLNSNFDYLSCNSTNTAGSSNPSPNPSPTSAQELAVCANAPPFQTWRWVPGTWETGNVPEYFMVGIPVTKARRPNRYRARRRRGPWRSSSTVRRAIRATCTTSTRPCTSRPPTSSS